MLSRIGGGQGSRDQRASAVSDHRKDGLEGQGLPTHLGKRGVQRLGDVTP